jgi:hypothetical protein
LPTAGDSEDPHFKAGTLEKKGAAGTMGAWREGVPREAGWWKEDGSRSRALIAPPLTLPAHPPLPPGAKTWKARHVVVKAGVMTYWESEAARSKKVR